VEYPLLAFLHVILFAYWLGGDLGVHLAARFAIRADLSFAERMRFLTLILLIDLAPETAIVLMVPVGLTLATKAGWAGLDGYWLILVWALALLWLYSIWRLHLFDILRPGEYISSKPLLHRIEHGLRNLTLAFSAVMGVSSLLGYGPLMTTWLSVKVLLYALALVLVGLLRHELGSWAVAIEKLQDPATVAEGNAIIMATHRTGRWYAWSLWMVVALAAYMGVAKPV
jgi:hypothetical protein